MFKLKNQWRKISDVMRFQQLQRSAKRLVLYCEGESYWPHLEGIAHQLLAKNIPVCFVSSSLKDPGLQIQHQSWQGFYIGDGFIRDWFFQNLEAAYVLMTMPDLHQYQVKRSRFPVHYIYLQHSLVSLHMVYREGAFNHYDTICCAGPHHVAEMQALIAHYQLPPKRLVPHGYSRLDALIQDAPHEPRNGAPKASHNILMAPSWGQQGLIESGLAKTMIEQFLEMKHQVILRPHPQTVRLAPKAIQEIVTTFGQHPRFTLEQGVAGKESLYASDIMVSDWSGAALEYAFSLKKPVLFCDIPRKVNNPNYQTIGIEPIEVSIRDVIGTVWDTRSNLKESLESAICKGNAITDELVERYLFNVGSADAYLVSEFEKGTQE